MDTPLVSFIIPAHNSGDTLENTVDSIIKHHMGRNIEILIVENGSTDNTEIIGSRICKQHKFVKLLKSDIGVSKARNIGILNAVGYWIVFVDSDDLVTDDIISYLSAYPVCDELILFGIEKQRNGRVVSKQTYDGLENTISTEKFQILCCNPDSMLGCIWGKIYSRSLLLDNNLWFNETLSCAEDIEFVLKVIPFISDCKIVHKCGYMYKVNENSATQKFNGKIADEYVKAMKEIANNKEINNECISHIVLEHLIFTVFKVSFHPQNRNYKECCINLEKLLEESIYNSYLKNICYKQYNIKKKIILFGLKHKLFFIVMVMTRINYFIKRWK